jgi:hypothetical protein
MSAAAKPRAPRRSAPHEIRKFRGFVLTRLGSETIEIAMPAGGIWGWAANWQQARDVVSWIMRGEGGGQRDE